MLGRFPERIDVGSTPRTDRLGNGPYMFSVEHRVVGSAPRADRSGNGPYILHIL